MRVDRTPLFDRERERFALKCACEDCAHFDRASDSCAHEWPTERHRQAAFSDGELVFCKEFELC
jgi:hypothetical protein